MHRRVGFLADDFERCNTRERGDEFGSEGVVLSMIFRPSKNKKAPQRRIFILLHGGADGTRTRDPRRDRPVF